MSLASGPVAGTTSDPSDRRIDLRPLFAPRSIAIVGASERGWIAETVRDNLRVMGSETRCHFVNPRHTTLLGQACYPSLADLPERPDIALVALNPLRAGSVTADAAAAGVPAVIIPGGGVVEGGQAAADMQREVAAIARRTGLALVGPNCMGVIDLTTRSACYIGDVSPHLPRGGVAGIAQSGSVTDAFVHSGSRVGFSRIISCGTEVVLDVCDYFAYCLDDPATASIILFLEGLKRPERFLALADQALVMGKPVMVVKVGRSQQAQAAAVAHSGSLAGEARVTDAAFDAAGIIRCPDLDSLIEAAELAEGLRRAGRSVGRGRTGIVTVSTGEASLVADLADAVGLDLPPIPDDTRAAILERLPTMGYIGNPLDPWGAARPAIAYQAAFESMAASEAYDVLVLVHDIPYREAPAEVATANELLVELLQVTRDRPHILPVYLSLTSGEPPTATARLLEERGAGAPLLRGAVEGLAAIAGQAAWQVRRERRASLGPWRAGWPVLAADRRTNGQDEARLAERAGSTTAARPVRILSEHDSLRFLGDRGLPVTDSRRASDADAAIGAARASGGGPVALKLDAVGLAHKSDLGGVVLDLVGDVAIRAAAATLLRLADDHALHGAGLLVEPMAAPGVEVILGVRRDALFGPAVLFGMGGVMAEILDDVAIRLAPLLPDSAASMISQVRGYPLLAGARGRPAMDTDALAAMLVTLSLIAMDDPSIMSIDLNPVIVGQSGALAVDALVVLDPSVVGVRP